MKTNFFGINAKLALAILAVSGSLFTSCYDSVDGDVAIPFTPLPEPVYSITGTVTNLATGMPISGVKVKFSGAVILSAPETSNAGSYYVSTKESGSYTVTVDETTTGQYNIASPTTLVIDPVGKGQSATYMFNVVLAPKGGSQFEGMKISTTSDSSGNKLITFDASTESKVDVINDGTAFKPVTFNFTLDKGARYVSDNLDPAHTRAADIAPLQAYINSYLTAIYGGLPVNSTAAFATGVKTYNFQLAPKYSLKSVAANTKYKNDTYKFSYDGHDYIVVVMDAYAYEFSNNQYPYETYHGHGHGHGGDLNAGGGIITPEI